MSLADCVDPSDRARPAARGRRRLSDDYQVARRYMVRLEPYDFDDEANVARLAKAGGLSPDEFKQHFARAAAK